jgi:hypothetical protein
MNGGSVATFESDSIRFSGYGATNAFAVDSMDIPTTPEPGTLSLIGLGMAVPGFARRARCAGSEWAAIDTRANSQGVLLKFLSFGSY